MTERRSFLTVENTLYGALFLLALALRLYRLNLHPLADLEAGAALLPHQWLFGGASATLPHSPAYFTLTYLSFLLFGASNATARLAPALAGAALTLIPALFRPALGRGPALLTSLLLALSATLQAASRTADGTLIAAAGLLAGAGAFYQFRLTGGRLWLVAAALLWGLGLAAGGAFLTGALALGLTVLIVAFTDPGERGLPREVWRATAGHRGALFVVLAAAVGLGSTVGLTYMGGIGALAGSWLAWLGDVLPEAAGRPPQTLLLFLAVAEPLGLIFGVVGAWLSFTRGHKMGQWLTWLTLAALTLVLLRADRATVDLAWVAAPLAGLAALGLVGLAADLRATQGDLRLILTAHVVIVLILLSFAVMSTASFAERVRTDPFLTGERVTVFSWSISVIPSTYLGLSLVALFLIGLTSYLIALGWSTQVAVQGLTLGAALMLGALGLRTAWGATQLRADSPAELWWERPVGDDLNLLVQTASRASDFHAGTAFDADVTIQGDADGALGWAFRQFPAAVFVSAVDPGVTSALVVAPAGEQNPTLGSAYVGQDFVFRRTWTPALSWTEWVGWLAFRRAPVQAEHYILWIRQDVAELQSAQ